MSEDGGAPKGEPMFNAPWPAVLLAAVIVGGYALQSALMSAQVVDRFAFSPADLVMGRYETLLTAIFLSGGWAHALMNGAAALAFGTPLARAYGLRIEGAVAFLLFFVVTGVLANLGYGLLRPGGQDALIGASGGGAALMGATARVIGGRGWVGPMVSPPVLAMGTTWLVVNLVVAVLGFVPGFGGGPVAWEVHLLGFGLGVLLAGPFAWLSQRHIFD